MEETDGIDFDRAEASNQMEKATNYFRLVQLTMIEGTNVVRKSILNRLRQGKTLHTILAERRSEFLHRGSGFNRQQLGVLYPVYGNADLGKIDMTLWFVLGRKLRVLPQKQFEDLRSETANTSNNTSSHPGTPVEWCQDLATIHGVRNNLFHLVKPELETEIFDDQWKLLTEALLRLDSGLDQSVLDRYRTAEMNPKAVIELRAMIVEQCLQERCEDLADELLKRNRIIHRILLVAALVLLLILAAALIFTLLFRLPQACDKSLEFRVIGDLAALSFMPRSGWGAASPSRPIDPLHLPAEYIIYTHTDEISACRETEECCRQVKNIQYLHMYKRADKFPDIGFHYLIDNKGVVFDGRDITRIPNAVYHWDSNITSVAFIGNFMYQIPTVESLAAFDLLIAYMRYNKYITRNYTIYGMCECRNTDSPGRILYDEINTSKLKYISGHVRHRPGNYCSFDDSLLQRTMNNNMKCDENIF